MLTFIRAKFSSFTLFLYTHRRWAVGITVFFLMVGVGTLFTFQPAHALGDWSGLGDALIRWISGLILSLARLALRISIFIVSFIIQIAAYNGYLSSTPVNIGWTVVLNLTNMFFVVILLIIAFATILGIEQYEWKKLLPKFFFAAVLINFSRTICGVLIDASQVFMSAFTNAVAATAGALYINGFGLDKLEKINSNVKPGDLLATGIFTSSVAALFFATLITCAFGAYLFILVARLVRLWILIILSPLAFALSVLPRTQSMASQWWSELGDNLVTGPIIMFFMWLSLVAAGSGNLSAQIAEKSNIPAGNKISSNSGTFDSPDNFILSKEDTEKQRAQSAGLTDILTWDNMARFIIAIALLFAGAQVASKIGGSSGNLMAAGLNFGKRVATIATGVAAGQWLYGKATGAATSAVGYVANKVPFVGGDAWRRRAMRYGGRLRGYRASIEEYQNKKASDLEKKAEGYAKQGGVAGTAKNWWARVRASAWESGGRKDALAENWKEWGDAKEKIVEKTRSTSSHASGKAKLEAELQLERTEAAGKSAGDLKRAKKEAELEGRIHPVEAAVEAAREAARIAGKDNKEINKAGEEAEKKALEGLSWNDQQYYGRTKKMLEGRAEAEQIKKELHDREARLVAESKDRYLEDKRGVGGGFLDQELARQSKEAQERAGVASYDKSMAKVGLINEKIRQAIKDGNSNLVDTLQKELNNLLVANINRGALYGVNGELKALETGGRTVHGVGAALDQGNLMAAQANFLSTKLGKNVQTDRNSIDEAVTELEEKMGAAYLEQMTDSINTMSEQGASHYAGLFRGEMVNGEYKIRATDLERKDAKGQSVDQGYVEGKREWAISQSKFNRIHGFDASVDQELDSKGATQTRIHSEAALNNLSKIFAGLTSNNLSSLDQNNVDTLARAIKNAQSGSEVTKILETIKEAASGGNKDELIKALTSRIEKSTAIEGKKIEELKNMVAKATGGGGGGTTGNGGGPRDTNKRPART